MAPSPAEEMQQDPEQLTSPIDRRYLRAVRRASERLGVSIEDVLANPGLFESELERTAPGDDDAADVDDELGSYEEEQEEKEETSTQDADDDDDDANDVLLQRVLRASRMPPPQPTRFDRSRSVAPGVGSDDDLADIEDDDEDEIQTDIGSVDGAESQDEIRAQAGGDDDGYGGGFEYEDEEGVDDDGRFGSALGSFDQLDDDDDGMLDASEDGVPVDPALDADNHRRMLQKLYTLQRGSPTTEIDSAIARLERELTAIASGNGNVRLLARPTALGGSSAGGSSSLLATGSSTSTPTPSGVGQSAVEREQQALATQQRQLVNSRRPVATKKGKFWKVADLPVELLEQILGTAASDLVNQWQAQLPERLRATSHRYIVNHFLAHVKVRAEVARWRLVSKSWREATDNLSFWQVLLLHVLGPSHVHMDETLPRNSTLFSQVWRSCWACIANSYKPQGVSITRTQTVHGPVFLCKQHSRTGSVCGRCLVAAECLPPGVWVFDTPIAEADHYGCSPGGRSSACTFCRRDVLDQALALHRERPPTSNSDAGTTPYCAYIDEGAYTAYQAAVRIVEARWLDSYTRYGEMCEQFRQQRLLDRPPRVARNQEDKQAMWLAMKDLANAAGDDDSSFATLQAFEELADTLEDGVGDSDGDGSSDLGGDRLPDDEATEVARLALSAFVRERVLAGYWVAPAEHRRRFQVGWRRLLQIQRPGPIPLAAQNAALYDPLPVRHPSSTTVHMPAPAIYAVPPPSLPLAVDVTRALDEMYPLLLEAVLRPALDSLVSGFAGLSDGGALAAANLPTKIVLGFVRTSFAWERGAGAFLRGSFADAERAGMTPEQLLTRVIEAATPLPPSPSGPPSDSRSCSTAAAADVRQQAPDSPLIGPVQPPWPPPPSLRPASPRSTSTTAGGQERSHSPSSHSTHPSPAFSTPPTSTSPSPSSPTADDAPPKPSTTATTALPDPPLQLRVRLRSGDPRPVTSAIPAIPTSFADLGPETVEILGVCWQNAWQPLTLCACPICRRATGRDAVGHHPAATAAAVVVAEAPASEMEEAEVREMTGCAKPSNGKRKEESGDHGCRGAADDRDNNNVQPRDGEGDTSPVPAKRARVDTDTMTPAPVDGL